MLSEGTGTSTVASAGHRVAAQRLGVGRLGLAAHMCSGVSGATFGERKRSERLLRKDRLLRERTGCRALMKTRCKNQPTSRSEVAWLCATREKSDTMCDVWVSDKLTTQYRRSGGEVANTTLALDDHGDLFTCFHLRVVVVVVS